VELSKLTQHLDKITASLSDTQSKISQYHTKTIELNSQLEHQLKQNGSQLQDLESKNREIKVLQAKAKELGEAKEAEGVKLSQ
jgi:chromosome segregation ATPase